MYLVKINILGGFPYLRVHYVVSCPEAIALMCDDVQISLVTSKRGLVVMVSLEY